MRTSRSGISQTSKDFLLLLHFMSLMAASIEGPARLMQEGSFVDSVVFGSASGWESGRLITVVQNLSLSLVRLWASVSSSEEGTVILPSVLLCVGRPSRRSSGSVTWLFFLPVFQPASSCGQHVMWSLVIDVL